MNAPPEKIPRKYTEKEERALEENLTPEQRLVACRVFKSVSAKGISNSRHNKRIEFVEYLESFIDRVAWLALTQREKEKLR
ncbi:hypothetical protein P8F49_002265 [Salmonella enterica]|uniref:Uncharacterized protein n=1 Tax=Salmonella enterica TaxID=28901 RepID=A0A402WBE2_SALER|nr:hypothetical protein [Salmonella enterica]EBW8696202.1 hypothetical protein [Salmonella enterica subsp. diarizonae serovar 16:z10:e,n,x,z15]ECG1719690.1 hypothetical protein [Salmonella enterica subsp. diarizonae serovar 17:z10:e,n,x,z15]EAM8741565.1 hypothetical protein [Salmonella enterica]EAS2069685.1 hypothetical protein [Salmonella enterica]